MATLASPPPAVRQQATAPLPLTAPILPAVLRFALPTRVAMLATGLAAMVPCVSHSGVTRRRRSCSESACLSCNQYRMMNVMQKMQANAKAAAKQASHERIVAVASRAIRKTGYAGTGVADIMKQAGLTHGAFYAHFDSRDAMLAEVADRAGAESVVAAAELMAQVPPAKALETFLRDYLSEPHVASPEHGCPVAALCSEMPRQAPEVRRAATRHIKAMVDLVARQSPDWGQSSAHEQALATLATAVGALVLARAVDEPGLSSAFCQAALARLAPPKG